MNQRNVLYHAKRGEEKSDGPDIFRKHTWGQSSDIVKTGSTLWAGWILRCPSCISCNGYFFQLGCPITLHSNRLFSLN